MIFIFLMPLQGIFIFDSIATYAAKYFAISILWIFSAVIFLYKPKKISSEVFHLVLFDLCFLVISLVSLWVNGSGLHGYAKSWFTFLTISIAPLVLLIFSYEENLPRVQKNSINILLLGISFVIVVSFLYYFTRYSWLIPSTFLNRSTRLYGAIKSPNALALFSVVGIGCVIVGIQYNWFERKVSATFLFLFFYALITSLSKSVFMSGCLAALVWYWLARRWKIRWPKGMSLLLSGVFVVALFFASVSILWKQYKKPLKSPRLQEHVVSVKNIPKWKYFNPNNKLLGILRIKPQVLKTGNRLGVWKAGLRITSEHWLAGIGQFNWKQRLAEKGYEDYDSPHNGFLEIAGGLGAFGALLYFIVPVWLIRTANRLLSTTTLSIAVVSMVVFYLGRELTTVSGIFAFSINGMLFWFLVGFFLSFASSSMGSARSVSQPHRSC